MQLRRFEPELRSRRSVDEMWRSCSKDQGRERWLHCLQLGRSSTEAQNIIQTIYSRSIKSLMIYKNEEHLQFLNTMQKQKFKESKREKFNQLNH